MNIKNFEWEKENNIACMTTQDLGVQFYASNPDKFIEEVFEASTTTNFVSVKDLNGNEIFINLRNVLYVMKRGDVHVDDF